MIRARTLGCGHPEGGRFFPACAALKPGFVVCGFYISLAGRPIFCDALSAIELRRR